MSCRVTDDEVKAIFPTNLTDLTPFITLAALTVDERLVGKGMTDARLKEIERWLAAHFATISDENGGVIRTRYGETQDYYNNNLGKFLSFTRYGQQVLVLDTSGTLAADENRAKSSPALLSVIPSST